MCRPLAPPSALTVLVISSDRVNLQLMSQIIAKRDDLKLLTGNNGRDGMELASACQPDVVVMDTQLTDICARDALKWLRKNPETSHIPIIAVSADALKTQVDAALRAGFCCYLTKPFKLTDFLEAIYNSPSHTLVKMNSTVSSSRSGHEMSLDEPVHNHFLGGSTA